MEGGGEGGELVVYCGTLVDGGEPLEKEKEHIYYYYYYYYSLVSA